MKRSYTCGFSKRALRRKKEEQLGEVLVKTKMLNELWTPTLMAPPTVLPEVLPRDDESNESDCYGR